MKKLMIGKIMSKLTTTEVICNMFKNMHKNKMNNKCNLWEMNL